MAAIGIDLGTTNCCIAGIKNGNLSIIANDKGKHTTPSMVAFCEKSIYFGESAMNKMNKYPEQVIYGLKYLIGRKYNDTYVEKFRKQCSYNVLGMGNMCKIAVDRELLTPELLDGFLLKELKTYAEKWLGVPVASAVIAVPTYFEDSARQATINAGLLAGFNKVELLNEPTAAALAYKVENSINHKTILVFDFGGGTFDISILSINQHDCKVLAIDGDLNLGGDKVDDNLINYVSKEVFRKTGEDVRRNKRKLLRLRKICEKAKCDLSSEKKVDLDLMDLGMWRYA